MLSSRLGGTAWGAKYRVLRVVEGAEDAVVGVAADADVMKALPAAAGRALVGSVTASSDC